MQSKATEIATGLHTDVACGRVASIGIYLKKIEGGTISSFDALMRVLRILGELEKLTPLIEEDELSPNEYFELVESAKKKQRKRASSKKHDNIIKDKEESEW